MYNSVTSTVELGIQLNQFKMALVTLTCSLKFFMNLTKHKKCQIGQIKRK